MITGIGHIAITCKDIDKSLDFYTRILGLPEAFRMNNDDGSLWMVYLKTGSDGFIELFTNRHRMPRPVVGEECASFSGSVAKQRC